MTSFCSRGGERFCNGATGGTGTHCQPLQLPLTDGNNDDVKRQMKRYITKYVQENRVAVQGMSNQELVDNLYTEMAEFSFLTKYILERAWKK